MLQTPVPRWPAQDPLRSPRDAATEGNHPVELGAPGGPPSAPRQAWLMGAHERLLVMNLKYCLCCSHGSESVTQHLLYSRPGLGAETRDGQHLPGAQVHPPVRTSVISGTNDQIKPVRLPVASAPPCPLPHWPPADLPEHKADPCLGAPLGWLESGRPGVPGDLCLCPAPSAAIIFVVIAKVCQAP